MNFKSLTLGIALAFAGVMPVSGTDYHQYRSPSAFERDTSGHLCPQGRQIFTNLAYSEIMAAVTAYHEEAVVATEQSQFSRSMRYNWALETKAWCGSAIGYSWTRSLDEETVAKCACFHYTMIRQR